MDKPLCGWPWYQQHHNDYSQAYIDSLTIELRINDKVQARVQSGEKKRKDRGAMLDKRKEFNCLNCNGKVVYREGFNHGWGHTIATGCVKPAVNIADWKIYLKSKAEEKAITCLNTMA